MYDPSLNTIAPLRAAVETATNKARAASFQFDLARERLAAAELAKTRADADLREAKYRLEQAGLKDAQ